MSRVSWITALGLLLSAVFVYLAVRNIELSELAAAFRGTSLAWALPAMALYFVGHAFRGVRSRLILAPHTDIHWFRAMNLVLIGYAVNNILPARLGELVRTYVLGQLQSMSKATALATVFVERVFDGLAIVAILFVVTAVHDLPREAVFLGWIGGGVFLGAFSVVLAIALWGNRFLALADTLLRRLPDAFRGTLLGIFQRLMSGMDFVRSRSLLLILLLSACVWLAEGAMFVLVLPVFGLEISAVTGYFATSITNLALIIPSSPGYVGTFHEACKESLVVFSIPAATALAYAVVVHALHFVPVTLSGLIALHTYGFGLGSVVRKAQQTEPPSAN